jgi:nitrate reductase beta subunit
MKFGMKFGMNKGCWFGSVACKSMMVNRPGEEFPHDTEQEVRSGFRLLPPQTP